MTDLDELNPFDFQRPVRTTKRLVGRQWQLRLFADALDSLVEGSPKHALVLGPTGYGKTSLLNGFADEALRAGVLPVRFRPSDSVVSSGEAVFEAMLTAAMLSVEATADLRDDPRFQNWLAQIGRSDPGPTHPTLLSHVQPFTDATTIARDCRVISELAREAELKGVVMLLHDGEALRDDEIISDTLAALLE